MNALLTSLNTENPLDARLEQIIEAAIARLQAGEPIDLAALAAEHPEYAAELNELLPTVARLVRLGDLPQQSAASKAGEPAQLPYQQLGDFRILARSAAAAWASSTRPTSFPWAAKSP